MSTKTKTTKAKAKSKAQPYKYTPWKPVTFAGAKGLSKLDLEIMQGDQGTYFLLIEAIMQNKRMTGEIVHRWLREKGLVTISAKEANDEFHAKYPQFADVGGKADKAFAAQEAKIKQYQKEVMDSVR